MKATQHPLQGLAQCALFFVATVYCLPFIVSRPLASSCSEVEQGEWVAADHERLLRSRLAFSRSFRRETFHLSMFYERITSWAWILRTFLSILLATTIMYRTLSCNHVVCDNLHAPLHLIHWRDFFAPLVSFAQDNGWSTLRSVSAFNAASVSFFDCVLTISPPQSSQGRELCNTQFTTFLLSIE